MALVDGADVEAGFARRCPLYETIILEIVPTALVPGAHSACLVEGRPARCLACSDAPQHYYSRRALQF